MSDNSQTHPFGFDKQVMSGGYSWWYMDFLSEDKQIAMTVIAFIGSVFSPYYAFARKRGDTAPENFCSINAVLYKKQGKCWAMTERPSSALSRDADSLNIGPSAWRWHQDSLEIEINEWMTPLPRKLRGLLVLKPSALNQRVFQLDDNGEHHWQPIAPRCEAELRFTAPAFSLRGTAYIDHNIGSRPLESGFKNWDWSRAELSDGGTAILYNRNLLNGSTRSLGVQFDQLAQPEEFDAPENYALPPSPVWRIKRQTQSQNANCEVVKTLEDTPFYVRSLVSAELCGEQVTAVHESLDMQRFVKPIVQLMLPFRMPRNRFYRQPV